MVNLTSLKLLLLKLLSGHFHPLEVPSLVLGINWDMQARLRWVLEPDIYLNMKGCAGESAVWLGCLHAPLLAAVSLASSKT